MRARNKGQKRLELEQVCCLSTLQGHCTRQANTITPGGLPDPLTGAPLKQDAAKHRQPAASPYSPVPLQLLPAPLALLPLPAAPGPAPSLTHPVFCADPAAALQVCRVLRLYEVLSAEVAVGQHLLCVAECVGLECGADLRQTGCLAARNKRHHKRV